MAKRPQDLQGSDLDRNNDRLNSEQLDDVFADDDELFQDGAEADDDGDTDTVTDDTGGGDIEAAFDQGGEEAELRGKFPEDREGNLLDPRTRRVAAKAGKERNVFQQLKKAYSTERGANIKLTRTIVEMTKEMRSLWGRYKKVRDEKRIGEAHNLSPQETSDALTLMALAKSDPRTALNRVLTMAHLRGIDLTKLGVNGPLDPAAVAEHVARIQTDQAAERERTAKVQKADDADAQQAQVQQEVTDFLDRNRDARGVDGRGVPIIKTIIEGKVRFPHMTLDEVWFHIKRASTKRPDNKQRGDGRRITDAVTRRQSNRTPGQSKTRGFSLDAAHPSSSFDNIANDLLKDIQEYERG